MLRSLSLLLSVTPVLSSTLLWDGRFNDLTSSTDLNAWSFNNEVGPYQYYIHGAGPVTEYINFDASFKNPADISSAQGAKITIDNTSYWNSDGMRRTELIPQTKAAINSGHVYYHFSISRSEENAPGSREEHQVAFFESHFTELKYGLISGEQGVTEDGNLRWEVGGLSEWNATFEAGVWHNIAYDIDFDAGTVGFWHSTGSDALTQVVKPLKASTSSNGADWHVGVLRLPGATSTIDDAPEDWLFSGVYIESGDLTTSVSGPGDDAPVPASSASPVASSTTVAISPSSSAAAIFPAPLASSIVTSSVTDAIATSLSVSSAFPTLTLNASASSAAAYSASGSGSFFFTDPASSAASAVPTSVSSKSKKKCSSVFSSSSSAAFLPKTTSSSKGKKKCSSVLSSSSAVPLPASTSFATATVVSTAIMSNVPSSAACAPAVTVTVTPTITVTSGEGTESTGASLSGFKTLPVISSVTGKAPVGPTAVTTAETGAGEGSGGKGLTALIEELLRLVDQLLAREG